MKEKEGDLLTAGEMAKALGASDARVKKAIKELAIQPTAKKGVCNYYSRAALARVRAAIAN